MLTTPSLLRTLEAGELVKDKLGNRYRVQKQVDDGVRLRDNDGARDFPYADLASIGLSRVAHDESGPAARRLGELRQEATRLGVNIDGMTSVKQIETAIGLHLAEQSGADVLDQIDPQLAADGKDLQDYSLAKPWLSPALMKLWTDQNWIVEEKLDGVRLKLHLTPAGGRVDSRRRDTKTRRFSEKSANFPHIRSLHIPELEGTVLDCEAMLPVTQGVSPVSNKPFWGSLSISTACCNAGPDSAALIQDRFGPMRLHVFDCLIFKGKDITDKPAHTRRVYAEKIVAVINKFQPSTEEWLVVTKQCTGTSTTGKTQAEEKIEFFERLVEDGGEGIIFKNQSAPYRHGKRDKKAWLKLKKFQEIDAFVTGYIPGEHGYEGLVGALELAVRINGQDVGIAAVSQITLEERKAITAPDGSLKPEILNRVITFRGQELTKHGRFRHAIFVSWREDKASEDCDGYELVEELKALKVI